MFRNIFVLVIIVIGIFFSLQGAFYALLFYLWNAYFRPDYWSYFGLVMSMKLSLIIGIYLVLRTVAMTPSPKINLRTILIWLFFGQCIVGCFTSENSLTSFFFLQDFAKVLIITYLIVILIDDRKQFRLVILVMAMSLGFETAKQGWAGLVLAPGAPNTNPIPFLGDNNGVAVGTMMLVPLLGALAQTSQGTKERLWHRFMAIGVFMKGITTYSRGGFLGAGALGIILILRAEKKIRATIVVGFLAFFLWQVMPNTFWARMNTITVEESQRDESQQGRLHFWQVGIDMASAKPMTGVGLASYNKSYERYNRDPRFTSERSAHSSWFGVLGDLGYPGLVLFILNIVMAFWSCWRVGRLAKRNPELRHLRIYANAIISELVVFCVGGTFVSGQYNEMVWHVFGLATALHLVAIKESNALTTLVPTKRAA